MDPRSSMLLAGVFALPAAVLAAVCLPAAAAVAGLGVCLCVCTAHPRRFSGLVALPVLLAAMAPAEPAARSWPRPGPVRLAGTVERAVHLPDRGVTVVHLRGGPAAEPLRLCCAGSLAALRGDRLTAVASLRPGAAPDLPPSLFADPAAVRIEPAPPSLPRLLDGLRSTCERALLALVPGENGPVLATLVLGRGTRAPREVAEAHRGTGLSHLLAVSGAHAAMLGFMLGLGGLGGGRAARRRRLGKSRAHVSLALLVLFSYAGISGAEPPVVRAVIMYALGALAVQVGRPVGLLVGLMVPALVTAATAPAALLGPSFLLSYAAVCGLSLAEGGGDGAVQRWLLLPLRASFWATCTTAPITLFWFGQIAPWTILLTPLLAPVVALMLLLGLLAGILGAAAPGLAAPLAPLLDGLTGFYVAAVHAADHLPGTPIRALCEPAAPAVALAATAGGVAVLALRGRVRIGAALLAAVVPWFLPLPRPLAPGLSLFAVGHGQAALLATAAGELVVLDCGSLQVPWRAAQRVLAALPIRRVDWLVITHGDHDHHNGVQRLLQRATVEGAVLPAELARSELAAALRTHGARLLILRPGETARPVDALAITAPRLPPGSSANDKSLWAEIELAGLRVLLCGDAEAAGVAAALEQGVARPSDVLVLPHHGRHNPAAAALLAAVRPSCCLVSAASADGETELGALARATGADVRVTGLHGDLTIRPGASPSLQCERADHPIRTR